MNFTLEWILSLAALLLTFLCIVFLAKFTVNPIDSQGFSFKRVFPFEALKRREKVQSLYIFCLCLFAASAVLPLFNLITHPGEIENIKTLTVTVSSVFCIAAIIFGFLSYFDATHTKVHLILFVLFLCFTLLGNALAAIRGVAIYKVYAEHNKQYVITLVGAVICGVSALFCAILAVNPKLKNWAELEKVNNIYERPKVFVLAYYEWLIFFALTIGQVGNLLVLLVQ